MKLLTSAGTSLLLVVVALAGSPGSAPKQDAKEKLARVRLAQVDAAIQGYYVEQAHFPESLQALTEATNDHREFLAPDAILDPWKKPYQYDPSGPKNKGKKPDVWTVTPGNKVIGNWPGEKR